MTKWCVLIAAAAVEETDPALGPDTLEAFVQALIASDPDGDRPAISAGPLEWSTQLMVDSETAAGALPIAAARCYAAARDVGIPPWPIIRLGVVRAAELQAGPTPANQSPAPADPAPADPAPVTEPAPSPGTLVGVTEIAGIFGVSRQRASEVARMRAFPEPVAQLASGPVWQEPAVLRFAETWERKPGRPRKSPPPAATRP